MGDRTERNARQRASRNLYNELTYKTIAFRVRQSGADGLTADTIKAAAAAAGESVNQYIIGAVKARMEGTDK